MMDLSGAARLVPGAGSAVEAAGVLLGYHDRDGKLQYASNVGTGWAPPCASAWRRIEVARSRFAPGTVKSGRWSKRAPRAEHWVKPELGRWRSAQSASERTFDIPGQALEAVPVYVAARVSRVVVVVGDWDAALGALAPMWVCPASRCALMELYSCSNPSSVEESRDGSFLTTLERKAPSSP